MRLDLLTEDRLLTQDERTSILNELKTYIDDRVNEGIEKGMLDIAQVEAIMMRESAIASKVKTKFLQDNPTFEKYPDIMSNVISEIQKKNPGLGLEKVLEKSVSDIKSTIEQFKGLDITSVDKPKQIKVELKSDSSNLGDL